MFLLYPRWLNWSFKMDKNCLAYDRWSENKQFARMHKCNEEIYWWWNHQLPELSFLCEAQPSVNVIQRLKDSDWLPCYDLLLLCALAEWLYLDGGSICAQVGVYRISIELLAALWQYCSRSCIYVLSWGSCTFISFLCLLYMQTLTDKSMCSRTCTNITCTSKFVQTILQVEFIICHSARFNYSIIFICLFVYCCANQYTWF